MKKLVKTSLILLVLLSFLGIFLCLNDKSEETARQGLFSSLILAIQKNRSGEIAKIDFSLFSSFSWDRLYVFAPYTTPEKIDVSLGKFWIGSRFTEIESSDRITLLVFTNNGQVAQYLEFPRSEGDFSSVANETGYPKTEAQFKVDEKWQMFLVFTHN